MNLSIAVVNGVEKNFRSDLECVVRVIEEIPKSIEGCNGDTGTEFGYFNPIKNKSYVLGEACYHIVAGRVNFVHTKLSGASHSDIVELKLEGVEHFNQPHLTTDYKFKLLHAAHSNQQKQLFNEFDNDKRPLLRLSHYLGFNTLKNKQLLPLLKLPWNYVIVNGGFSLPNWESLQNDIRNLNIPSYELYFGSRKILQLPKSKSNNNKAEIILTDNYPVPMYLWLLIKTEDKAAAFVVLNNPNAEASDLAFEPCTSKCTQLKWLKTLLDKDAYKNRKNGHVWCCELANLNYEELPQLPQREKFSLLESV